MEKLTTEEFIRRAKQVHGDKYDYSKVNYTNYQTKVCVICKEHGEFLIRPSDHLRGVGCTKCCGTYHYSTEEWIEVAKAIHGNKYDYSKVNYVNSKTKVCIICPKHGEFYQRPNDHLNKNGCPKCANKNVTTEEFIEKARKVHGDKYDYSKVEYVSATNNVKIICPKHGEFSQQPNNHLTGSGCPLCSNIIVKSKMSRKILELLLKNGLEVEEEKTFSWLKNKHKLRLDFYLPKYNIGIEVQGDQHYTSVKKFGGENGLREGMDCDAKKRELCELNNVKLFYITKKQYNINEIMEYIHESSSKE